MIHSRVIQRIRFRWFSAVILLLIPSIAYAYPAQPQLADIRRDPIASTLHTCLGTHSSWAVLAVRRCYVTAINAYELTLRRLYDREQRLLDQGTLSLLRTSQADWLRFHRAELATQRASAPAHRAVSELFRSEQSTIRDLRSRITLLYILAPNYEQGAYKLGDDPFKKGAK